MLFTGEYEHSIDSKSRLAIPADLRSRMEAKGLSNAFFLVPMEASAIWLWPEDTFERLSEEFGSDLLQPEDLAEFDAVTFPSARYSSIDTAGRIRVPEEMLQEAGLGPNVMIIGVRDHLELRDPGAWKRERLAKRKRQSEIMLRARQALARRNRPGGERDSGSTS